MENRTIDKIIFVVKDFLKLYQSQDDVVRSMLRISSWFRGEAFGYRQVLDSIKLNETISTELRDEIVNLETELNRI